MRLLRHRFDAPRGAVGRVVALGLRSALLWALFCAPSAFAADATGAAAIASWPAPGPSHAIWDDHRELVLATAAVFALLLAATAALLLENRRRRAAERLASESERRWKLLVENAPEAVTVFDLDRGVFVEANGNAERLFGRSREEILGSSPLGFYADIQPDGLPAAESTRRMLERAVQGEHVVFERAVVGPAGRPLRCEVNLLLLPGDGARRLRVSFVDITERHAAEQRAVRLAAFYAALSLTGQAIARNRDEVALMEEICRICVDTGHADQSNVVLAESDAAEFVVRHSRDGKPDGLPTRFSLSARPWLLTSQAILTGEPQVCADYRSDPRTAIARQHGYGGSFASFAAIPLHRAGRVCGALAVLSAQPSFVDEGVAELLGRIAAELSHALDNIDLEAARTRAQREAQAGFQRFRHLFRTLQTYLAISAGPGGLIVEINDALCSAYGIRREDALGRTLGSLGVGLTAESRQVFYREMERHGRVNNLEVQVTTVSGQVLTILGSAEPIDWEGRVCVLTTGVDITELRAAEKAREEMQRAKAADQAKTEFLSRMSHELRTPLNAVLGFAQLLDDPQAALSPAQREHLRLLREGGLHLAALVDDVLDVASIESGRLQVVTRPVALDAAIGSALALCAAAAARARVEVRAVAPAAEALHVLADPTRLRQVLANVVSNGIKYNRPGGSVTVSARADAGRVQIEIADDGQGMTPDQRQRLFTPYDRLGREGSGVAGTGIGLVLARQLVGLMDGQLSVDSEAGRGTRVRIDLPRSAAPTPPAVAAVAPRAAGDGIGRVLYIEDEPVNQLLVQETLRGCAGIELRMAGTGHEGIELAREMRPDLVLVDMQLPDMDGAAVMAALGAGVEPLQAPMVALSASAMSADIERARAAGAFEYWTKPFDIARLRDDVLRLLYDARRQAPEAAVGPAGAP